jgi:NAD(P)-dependent dehydrogenase (short-subunit alcohol dehydrogenase family)
MARTCSSSPGAETRSGKDARRDQTEWDDRRDHRRRYRHRVNVLSPGATATELRKEALGEEGQKVYASMTPLQRMADPAEIGAVAAFLASQDSSFMTGSEVAVDGGLA